VIHKHSHTCRFEVLASLYQRHFGYLAPGKSEPMETARDSNSEVNKATWEEWLATNAYKQMLERICALEQRVEELEEMEGAGRAAGITNPEKLPELVEALRLIGQMSGQTLLGQSPEHEFIPGAYPGEDRAHESGANKAFEQAAGVAQKALAAVGVEAQP